MDCIELKFARVRRKKSTADMAKAIGKSDSAWNQRERGDTAVSLREVSVISSELALSEQEFANIFFDGNLPFRK